MYRISFYLCGLYDLWHRESPLEKGTTPISPLTKGDRGGCKLVLVKTGIAQKKHNPLNRSTELTTKSPFFKGGLKRNNLRNHLHGKTDKKCLKICKSRLCGNKSPGRRQHRNYLCRKRT